MTIIRRHDTTFSPVGLWQLNGTLNDTSGNGFNLTVDTGTARYADMMPGFSSLLVNASRFIYNTTGTSLKISGDMTVECLIRYQTPSPTTTVNYLVGYAGGSGSGTQADNIQYAINIPSGLMGFTWTQESGSGSATSYALSTRVLTRTVVHHFAATRTSNVIQFYLNGRAFGVASSALTTPDGGTTSVFRIGGDGAQNAITGNIASLKVIASALSASQIAGEFNLTLGSYYNAV